MAEADFPHMVKIFHRRKLIREASLQYPPTQPASMGLPPISPLPLSPLSPSESR